MISFRYQKTRDQEPPKFMTVNETARYLRTSYRTVRRLIDEGRIPCAQLGELTYRIPRDGLDRFISGGGKIEADGRDGK